MAEYPATGKAMPLRSHDRGGCPGTRGDSMKKNTGLWKRTKKELKIRDPGRRRDRSPSGLSDPHMLRPASLDRRHPVHFAVEVPIKSARDTFAVFIGRIRDPLQVIQAETDLMEERVIAGKIHEQILRINEVLKRLEHDREESRRQSRRTAEAGNRTRSRPRRRDRLRKFTDGEQPASSPSGRVPEAPPGPDRRYQSPVRSPRPGRRPGPRRAAPPPGSRMQAP
jgi:hypothetical protein